MIVPIRKICNNTEIALVVTSAKDIIFSDSVAELLITGISNNANLKIDLGKSVSSIIYRGRLKDMLENHSTQEISFANTNGATTTSGACIFLNDLTISSFYLTYSTNFAVTIWIKKILPNLKKLGGYFTIASNRYTFDIRQDFTFFPSLQWYEGGWNAGLATLTTLKRLVTNLPQSLENTLTGLLSSGFFGLKHLEIYTLNFDVKYFFNGQNRMSINFLGTSPNEFRYSGGGIFPSTISDDADVPTVIHILSYNRAYNGTPPDSNSVSRFIVDFANQVNSVTGVKKYIRFSKSPPNTSYTDNSQPLFKNYSSALNHITTTLGITVTFT